MLLWVNLHSHQYSSHLVLHIPGNLAIIESIILQITLNTPCNAPLCLLYTFGRITTLFIKHHYTGIASSHIQQCKSNIINTVPIQCFKKLGLNCPAVPLACVQFFTCQTMLVYSIDLHVHFYTSRTKSVLILLL